MDSELLENASELIVKGILSQDLTFYVDLLSPEVTLNICYDAHTLPLPSNPDTNKVDTALDEQQQQHAASKQDAANADAAPSLPPAITSSACTVESGRNAFAESTFHIYKWLQKGKYVAQPRISLEPRKPRKDASGGGPASPTSHHESSPRTGGNKNGSGAFGPMSSFKSPTAANVQERNAKLFGYSRLTIVWGRTHVQLRDEIYFDEGQIFVVDRFLVVPEDTTTPQYAADRSSFLGESSCRVDTRADHPPVLDFTFAEINEVVDLLRVKPVSGRVHRIKGVQLIAEKADKTNSALFQLGAGGQAAAVKGAPPGQHGKILVKAKNKKGEEEAYEFASEERANARVIKAEKEQKDDIISKLAEQMTGKYEAEAFRLSNNSNIRDLSQLVPVLRTLISNSFLTLSWLDLSNNEISGLPLDLLALPLTSLYLHGNCLSTWADIDKVIPQFPHLHSLTLHGNPIAQQPGYKHDLLTMMLTSPKRKVPLKQLDFVAISTQDVVVSAMHQTLTKKTASSSSATASGDKTLMMTIAKQSISARDPKKVTPRGGNVSPRTSSMHGTSPRKTVSSSISPRR